MVIKYVIQAYLNTGNFTSRTFDAGITVNWTYLSWSNTTPARTNLTLYYRTSADNITFSNWNQLGNNILSATGSNSVGRYFQYLAVFNTSNTNITPILNNVTINYTGIFTDSFGNYNYTLTAPATSGTYTIKVNLYEINSLNKDNLDSVVRIKGAVESFAETPGLYLVNVKDGTGRITVVIFKDEPLDLQEGLKLEIIGTVVEYDNKL